MIASALLLDGTAQGSADSLDDGFIDTFKSLDKTAWTLAHYDFSHAHFDTDWQKTNAVFGPDPKSHKNGLTLHVGPRTTPSSVGNKFTGASVRRTQRTHYGRYESWIKPARGAGFVTGFFTYTGAHYGTQHDEIDIEFLGKNTRQIHLAWFHNGTLKNKFIDLPFDAADQPRHYAFEWRPDRISWFVEGAIIFSIDQIDGLLPQTPSMLFANVWAAAPSISTWSGKTKPGQRGKAWFGLTKFTPHNTAPNAESQDARAKTATKVSEHLALSE